MDIFDEKGFSGFEYKSYLAITKVELRSELKANGKLISG